MCECKDCKLNEGDCGHHFSMNGVIDYTIPSQTACDQCDCCMFFKPKKYETICDNCIHDEVCGLEDHLEPAMTYCGWKEEKRPQGEWIVDEDAFSKDFMKCSNCNEDAEWLEGGCQFLSNFCPNCGADMRGG